MFPVSLSRAGRSLRDAWLGATGRRTEDPSPRAVAAGLRALASLLDHHPARRAVIEWPLQAPPELRPACERIARRVTLGAPVCAAVESESWFPADVTGVSRWAGAGAGARLRAEASVLERLDREQRSVAAHVGGMRLSARIVGWLPLAFVPLVIGSGSLRVAAFDLGLVVAGLAVAVAGARWMANLVPVPLERSVAARIAERSAIELRCAAGLRTALARAAAAETGEEVRKVLNSVRLGVPWAAALDACDDPGLRSLGRLLTALETRGLPAAPGLRAFAVATDRETRSSFEEALRKAPVRMALPLTLCVLPACALLGVGPLLRNLGG